MPLTLSGSSGISGIDGSNTAPATRGSTQFAGISYAANTVVISTSGRTAATINSERSLLLNTTADPTIGGFPNTRLYLKQTTDSNYGSGIQIESLPRDSVGYLGMAGNNFVIGQSYRSTGATGGGYGNLGFWTGGGEVLTITNQARVGIGNTTPTGKLTVQAGGADGIVVETDNIANYQSARLFFNAKPSGTNFALLSTGNTFSVFSGSDPGQSTGTQRWSVDGSGRVLAPYQPVFSVYGNPAGITSGNLTWSNILNNVGNHMNISTGYFTAPVAGTYYFVAHVFSDTSAGSTAYWYILLAKNGNPVGGYSHSPTSFNRNYETMGVNGAVTLAAGDTASIYYYGASGAKTYGTSYGNFAGFLVG